MNFIMIETVAPTNIGQAVIDYLTEKELYGKIKIKTIHTTRDTANRVRTTVVKY